MTNTETLMAVIAIASLVVAAVAIVIPSLIRKGYDVGGIINSASAGVATADHAVDVLLAAAPDNGMLVVMDKLTDWARQAVSAAEQLYKTQQLDGDKRKTEAAKLVHQFATAAGVEVTNPLTQVIDGAIEAAVYALPRTDKPTTEK